MRNTRVKAQHNKMQEATRLGICPFCWENLGQWHDAPVLKTGEFWAITANDYPYAGSKYHYLAIYRDHISSIAEMAPGAGDELMKLFAEFCKVKKISGATIVMRFGDMRYTGATVFHLHAQIMSGASRDELAGEFKFPDDAIATVLGYKTPGTK